MKRTPKLTRKQRQKINGKGPAQAHFSGGKPFAYVTPTVKKAAPTPASTDKDCPRCGPGAKFKTVSKAKRQYRCRRCQEPVQR